VNPGDVVLIPLPQVVPGPPKLRPALILAHLPGPYGDRLVCGISTQLGQYVPNWDEIIDPADADFAGSGLRGRSVVRLSFLHAADPRTIQGVIGTIDPHRLQRILTRLADHLRP
jgi:mRNA interferase MazF